MQLSYSLRYVAALLLAEWKKVQRIRKSIVVRLEESHHAAL